MVGTKLALKEPFSCLSSKHHIRVIRFNYVSFSFFRLKQLWIECQKHENIAYLWNKVFSDNTFDTDLFKTFTENNKQKDVI